jgi:predicted GIY-YIG superfamily endonuclease
MNTADYQEIAVTLPIQPGIYKFIDAKGTILYVGKAKNLKSRLASYFGERKDRQLKTKALVRLAHRIEFTIVGSEQDALLLERWKILPLHLYQKRAISARFHNKKGYSRWFYLLWALPNGATRSHAPRPYSQPISAQNLRFRP